MRGLVLALIGAVAVPATLFAAPISCPAPKTGQRLVTVSVFDGPPSEKADLVPDEGGWTFDVPSKEGFYLVCTYNHRPAAVIKLPAGVIKLPAGVKACLGGGLRVRCA